MHCKEVKLNAILSGVTTSAASIFVFFRQSNQKFVIYNVVSLCWSGKPLAISLNDPNVFIFMANRSK